MALPALEEVVQAVVQDVLAVASADRVVALLAGQDVLTVASEQAVVALPADQVVVAGPP